MWPRARQTDGRRASSTAVTPWHAHSRRLALTSSARLRLASASLFCLAMRCSYATLRSLAHTSSPPRPRVSVTISRLGVPPARAEAAAYGTVVGTKMTLSIAPALKSDRSFAAAAVFLMRHDTSWLRPTR
uniref:Uncharacterized protein n=1 Tax=Prasinoderma singulare TaxID=676789 RepID=A0A7S3F8A3_9VIRI